MSKINKQVDSVRTSLAGKLPLSHPLLGHPISQKEEYVKSLYIDFLCVMAQYENEDTEIQMKFIQRIMAGSGMKEAITEHIKKALELTGERCDEFIKQCKDNQLTDIFVIDSLLIACADGTPNRKQIDFLSELACAFGLKKNHVSWLGGLAKAILEQSNEAYQKVCQEIPHDDKTVIMDQAACYIKEFISGILIDTNDLLWIYCREKQSIDLQSLVPDLILSRKRVVIENAVIELKNTTNEEDYDEEYDDEEYDDEENQHVLNIQSCENLELIHSEFIGMRLQLTAIQSIEIEDCWFRETSNVALVLCGCGSLSLQTSKFIHCGCLSSNDNIQGGVIQVDKNSNDKTNAIVSINTCEFKDCYIHSTYGRSQVSTVYYWAPILKGQGSTIEVMNSVFCNTSVIYKGWNRYKDHEKYLLDFYCFGDAAKESNNTIIGDQTSIFER